MSSPIEITSALAISGAIVIGAFILPAKQPIEQINAQKVETVQKIENSKEFENNNQINHAAIKVIKINIKTVEEKVDEIKKKLDLIEKKIEQRK